jgi:hypothetical protein
VGVFVFGGESGAVPNAAVTSPAVTSLQESGHAAGDAAAGELLLGALDVAALTELDAPFVMAPAALDGDFDDPQPTKASADTAATATANRDVTAPTAPPAD